MLNTMNKCFDIAKKYEWMIGNDYAFNGLSLTVRRLNVRLAIDFKDWTNSVISDPLNFDKPVFDVYVNFDMKASNGLLNAEEILFKFCHLFNIPYTE